MNLPEGWPTDVMIEVGANTFASRKVGCDWNTASQAAQDIFKSMLEWAPDKAILAAAPTPPALGNVVVTTDETGRAVAVTRQDEEGRILSVIWEAPTPPAQEDEPVAYMDVHDNWDLYKNKPEQIDVIPLYTRQAPSADDKHKGAPVGASDGCETRVARYYTAADDKLRKAAEEVAYLLSIGCPIDGKRLKGSLDNLCAVLEGR